MDQVPHIQNECFGGGDSSLGREVLTTAEMHAWLSISLSHLLLLCPTGLIFIFMWPI